MPSPAPAAFAAAIAAPADDDLDDADFGGEILAKPKPMSLNGRTRKKD